MKGPLFIEHPPKQLCILRLSAIGDVCHALAVVHSIQLHWPETEITWIIGKTEYELMKGLPNVRFVILDKKAGWQGVRNVWNALKETRFDVLLHMQAAFRASVVSLGIRAKYKVGFHWSRSKEFQWFFTNRHLQDRTSPHVLDSFYEFAAYIGVPRPSQVTWKIPLDLIDLETVRSWDLAQSPYVVIAPAASNSERNWLVSHYVAAADFIVERGYTVIFCGGDRAADKMLTQRICAQMKSTQWKNMLGKTTLKELVLVIRDAACVLGPDSGPLHIATTQGTTAIGLYAHSNPCRTGPYFDQDNVISAYKLLAQQQYNKPFYCLPWGARVKGYACMAEISVESVLPILERCLPVIEAKQEN